ncbi:MAG: ribosome silencing factor [Opitutales bacterium]|nr:ribosome silencing factor [Opitutales bacterium]
MPESIEISTLPEDLKACCEALLDKKAEDVTILDVKGHSSITDYYIIASGQSSPQLKAMAESARMALKSQEGPVGTIDGDPASGWVVMDAFAFVLHLFLGETRDTYALESLWKDRPSLVMQG